MSQRPHEHIESATPSAIELSHVSFNYRNAPSRNSSSAVVLDDISLTVPAGERLGVFGPNGAGKSTLLKLMLGIIEPCSGHIRIFDQSPTHARKLGTVGFVPQRLNIVSAFPVTARQIVEMTVACTTKPLKRLPAQTQLYIDELMELVGAGEFAAQPVGTLSGGQLQRVLIARALSNKPNLLLLDEPTVGIDLAGQQQFAQLLNELHRKLKLTIVMVSHDLRAIAAGCDRVACLAGSLHAHTSPDGITPAVLAEVFSHDVASVLGDIHVHAHKAEECHDETCQQEAEPENGS